MNQKTSSSDPSKTSASTDSGAQGKNQRDGKPRRGKRWQGNRGNNKNRANPKSASSETSNQESKSGESHSDKPQPRRRSHRSRNRNPNRDQNRRTRPNGQEKSEQQGEGKNRSQNRNRSQSKTGQRGSRNRGRPEHNRSQHSRGQGQSSRSRRQPKLNPNRPPTDKYVVSTYLKFMDLYHSARKKMYELFHRADKRNLRKIILNYEKSLSQLREFERKLPDRQKGILDKHINFFPEDLEFSTNHPEAELPEGEVTEEGKTLSERHLKPIQLERPSYKEDNEETQGTIDDYLQYKSTNSLT